MTGVGNASIERWWSGIEFCISLRPIVMRICVFHSVRFLLLDKPQSSYKNGETVNLYKAVSRGVIVQYLIVPKEVGVKVYCCAALANFLFVAGEVAALRTREG
jgi:hypothetical protein